MSVERTQGQEPFVRIVKRDGAPFKSKVLARALAIVLALVIDAVFIFAVTGLNPLSVYGVMFQEPLPTASVFPGLCGIW